MTDDAILENIKANERMFLRILFLKSIGKKVNTVWKFNEGGLFAMALKDLIYKGHAKLNPPNSYNYIITKLGKKRIFLELL